jgi:uncharacterized protein (TIGR03790 family)
LLLLVCAGALASPGADPGQEVVVVYNSRLPESKAVAEYYAQRRQVPVNQVFGFPLSTSNDMTRAEFRDALQKPLADALETKKLWHIASNLVSAGTNQPKRVEWKPVRSKIRYAVLCYGVPLRIASDPDLKEEGMEKIRPELRRNEAAVDSELALLPLLEEKPPLAGPLRNPVYTTTNTALLHPTNGVLLVARLDGPSPEIARGLVDKALEAETNGLWGRAYFDLRNTSEPGYKQGDDWIRSASEICRRLGFETIVDENPGTFSAGFPMSQIAFYAGWYDQDVSGPFTRPTVEFTPGAFAYHLHSFSAADLRSTNHFWVGPLLAKGATISMGCVQEPYLSGSPDVANFASRLIFYGFSFGEAAYASQPVLSWQTTVVGDPLYRPFGANPEELHDALQRRRSKLVEWSYLRLVNVNLAAGKPIANCVALLEDLGATKLSAVLSEKLGDLYLAQGKPSSAVHAYAKALSLDPSPQQRIRLLLTLGERLPALGRYAEAYDSYQKLLEENADYPDKIALYKKLLPLAQKLNKDAEAKSYEAAIVGTARPEPGNGK